jgi:hypothetical protein
MIGMTVALILTNGFYKLHNAFREDIMKTLFFALMVLGTLASCGKSNTVSSGAATTSITNPLITGSASGQSLASMISNPASFGQGAIASNNPNQTCATKAWGLIQYCYSSGSASTYSGATWAQVMAATPNITFYYYNSQVGTRQVTNTPALVASKQVELSSILNAATSVQVNGPIYYVTTASAQYVIDTRYPIQVNPSGTQNIGGATDYFIQAK